MLIALAKCPGVRPIGISECLQKIICKSVAEFTKIDLEETCSTDQLACGLKAAVEGTIHAISNVFDDNKKDGCGLLLMDAEHVFGVQLICGLLLVLDAEPVLGARVYLVQSRCLELVFGEELVSGAE